MPPAVPTRPAPPVAALDDLQDRIAAKTATVAVVGLGYVGLPLLLATADAGFPVVGIDVDPRKIAALKGGRSYITDVADAELAPLRRQRLTCDAAALGSADVVLVAVPTPLTDGSPDLSPVVAATAAVADQLRPGQLVVLESTTWPGTTEEVVQPLLDATGLVCGVDYALGYSPERVDPGSSWTIATTPKVVSGVGDVGLRITAAFYRHLTVDVAATVTPREAEMAKLIENTFRQVNIALVNELAVVARDLNVDIWSALDAAATKPFGYLPFWPGPGVGGHCIAVDPTYLSWRAEQKLGYGVGFVQQALAVNNRMPAYVVGRIRELLSEAGKPLSGAKVLAVGISYKPGVNDIRESPAAAVVDRLATAGANVAYHDPHVPAARVGGRAVTSTPLSPGVLADSDLVVFLAAGDDVDVEFVRHHARLVFDAQGLTRRTRSPHVHLL